MCHVFGSVEGFGCAGSHTRIARGWELRNDGCFLLSVVNQEVRPRCVDVTCVVGGHLERSAGYDLMLFAGNIVRFSLTLVCCFFDPKWRAKPQTSRYK